MTARNTPVRILLLEDDPNDAALIERELSKLGLPHELRRVATGDDFTRALHDAVPDVILSDHTLPGFGGPAALERAQASAPHAPFILVTGSLDEETAVAYLRNGAADYILKDRLARLGPAVRDALERARQRQTLRQHEQLLRQIIDANPNLIFVKDWDGRFVMANQALAQIYGTTVEQVIGKTDADFNPRQAEVERFLRDDQEVMSSGRPKLVAEEPVTHPVTKQTRWFQTIKVPLTLPEDAVPKLLGVATEITERKGLEEQLLQSQKMEAVGQLAGGVAHDFNNILTAIYGYADLLAADLPPTDRRQEDVEEIRKAARRAAALTRQLLAFSRKQVLEPRVLDLNALVQDVDRMLRPLLGEHVDLRWALASGLDSVLADPNQLEQVLLNLAINARDAMPQGGKLTVETTNTELDADYATRHVGVTPGRYVMLAVSDTGVGMDEATQARIFEPFFTTKRPGEGTGLGLSTVFGIVKQSGGHIWVYSEPGRGATFKIYLPAATEPVQRAPRASAPRTAIDGVETVLLVEDDEQLRRLARRALAARGYTVLKADRGVAALEAARLHPGPIHLLLTDVILPDTDGRSLAEALRAERPEMRVLYMSGYADKAIVHHGVLDAGVAYLPKPFTTEAVARKVREVLDTP